MENALVQEFDHVAISSNGGAGTAKLSGERPNVIRAYQIIVRGENKCFEQDVTLVANIIIFEEGSIIDTTGGDGSSPLPKPKTPEEPGDDNKVESANGNDGHPAGNITIIAQTIKGTVNLRGNGGKGGKAQDGGDGADAQKVGFLTKSSKSYRNKDDSVVSPGGDGAPPGMPGKSANGASVTISVISNEGYRLKTEIRGGGGVEPALAGSTGLGYVQRPAGDRADFPRGRIPIVTYTIDRKPGGMGKGGNPGNDGKADVRVIDTKTLAQHCTGNMLRKIQAEGEQDYINDNVSEALPRFNWVAEIASSVPKETN